MRRIFSFITKTYTNVMRFLKGLGTRQKWVAVVAAVLVIGGVGYAFFGPKSSTDDATLNSARSVELVAVAPFAENAETNVNSSAGSETTVRAETSGKITEVRPVGSRVTSGATIALFENAAQRAALLQAEGALEAATASLEKIQGGLRSEKIDLLQTAVDSAQSGAVATLLSAYGSIDSAVRDTADQMFSNPESSTPHLDFSSSDAQRRTLLENQRVLMSTILSRETKVSANLTTSSDLVSELNTTEEELRSVRSFIDTLIAALNEAIPTGNISASTISAYKASATAARTALTGALSSVASARGGLETANKNLEEGLAGAESTDLAAAAASVKQAQGAYNAALAAYQKTIVHASSAGTIVSCNAAVGDVLTVGSDVCRIKTVAGISGDSFVLPLSSVKYTPAGAFVFVVDETGTLQSIQVETGLVTAGGISVSGLLGDEYIVKDVRGLKAGENVSITQ